MAARPQLPGTRWLLWMRNAALRIGVLTGIYISCVLLAWLLVANRFPHLEPFAGLRNLVAGAVAVMVIAIPVLRFRHEPAKIIISGLVAWTILTFTYIAAELYFSLLETRMGALQFFILGGISYGLVAVVNWVFQLCREARHRHFVQAGQTGASNRPRSH